MPASRDSLPSTHPLGWLAWCASLAIHATLLLAIIYWLQPLAVRGAAELPTREIGIVLKKTTDEGPMFEGPDTEESPDTQNNEQPPSLADSPNSPSANDELLAALPNSTEIPSTEAALPELPTLGPSPLAADSTGQVDQMASGGASSKSFSSKATVSVFGIEGTGTRFVYVFDRSISMEGAPLRAAKEQLVLSLDSLDSIHQFQVIFFNHEPQTWDLTGGQNRIAFATDANKRLAEKFIGNVSATGGTFRRTALKLALRMRPDVVFFLTDTDDPMATNDLAEAIRRAQRDAIAINTIEYGNGETSANDNFLVQLARQTGGRYVYVDTQRLGR